MRTLLKAFAKTLGATLIIMLAGWVILSWSEDPTQGPQEAKADITSFDFAPKSKHERFLDTLREQGFERPRSYDWNGNTMFFSMKRTRDDPMHVLRDIQEGLVRHGVNKKAHLNAVQGMTQKERKSIEQVHKLSPNKKHHVINSLRAQLDAYDDFFGGGLVPTAASTDYISMLGGTSQNRTDSSLGFIKERFDDYKKTGKKKPLTESFRAMRSIEAFKNEGTNFTTVTAVWSDEHLDMNKFRPDSTGSNLSVNPKIPVCLGCTRLMRFAGEDKESKYVNNVYAGNQTVFETVKFYDIALGRRGWVRSESNRAMEVMRKLGHMPDDGTRFISYTNINNDFLSLLVTKHIDGRTITQLFESP